MSLSRLEARVLFVEDTVADLELTERQLQASGFNYESIRVETEPEFLTALHRFRPDIVVSDYSLPEFDGMRALLLTQKHDPLIPFIILTGSMNEETAVECMKAGASDYLIKGQTRRLIFALREALEQRRVRMARLNAERALRESEAKAHFLADNVSDVLWMLDPRTGNFTYVSPSVERLLGYSVEEILADGVATVLRRETIAQLRVRILQRRKSPENRRNREGHWYREEVQQRRRDGTYIWTEVVTHFIRNELGRLTVLGIARDISEQKISQSRLLLQSAALEAAANGIVITDAQHTIIWVNPAFTTFTGFLSEEVVGRNAVELISLVPEAHRDEQLFAKMLAAIEAKQVWQGQLAFVRKDGSLGIEDESITPVCDASGCITNYIAIFHDVTDQVRSQEALRLSEERYDLASRAANDALWDSDLRARTLFIAPRFAELLGYPPGSGPQTPEALQALVHPEDRARIMGVAQLCVQGIGPKFEAECRLQTADGSYRWFLARGLGIPGPDGKPVRFAGSVTDITERKVAEEQLLHDAFHDSLTGLPNRALFFDRLDGAVRRIRRDGELAFAVMLLDLDRFKTVNDSLGHLAGDELLVTVGHRIARCIRQTDTLARLGGDEFALLLEGTQDQSAALRIADRIVREIAAPLHVDARDLSISVSIGLAFGSDSYSRAVDIVRDADIALYRAKSLGRARYEIFDPAMHQEAVEALEVEQDLRNASARGELLLHYQPILGLADGRITGFEALIRWRHPKRGLISPADFIPLAEDTGLIIPIGEWVLREACAMLNCLAEGGSGGLLMNINLSAKQVYQPGIVELFSSVVDEAGIDPSRLHLEITESVLMDRPDFVSKVLTDFAAAGFLIHLDDFGTGYSSLKYLLEFPFHSIKIDRSFVKLIPADKRAMALVQTVLLLASQLELGVTAEGVETAIQLETLRGMGCQRVQGYLVSRPIPASDVLELVGRQTVW